MNKEQQNILTLYIGLIISTILNFVPIYSAQIFGAIFFLVLLIFSYIYKSQSEEASIQNSHARYIIKTIWIFSLFLLIGVILAGLFADNSAIQQTIDQVMAGVMMDETALESILSGYMKDNAFTFFVTIAPSFLYFFYRLIKGTLKIKNNNPMTNLKSWF